MDTDEIEVFLALAEELHFGRTAELLRLPQPQVTRLVARLERRAGGALFDRTNRRVRLTPLGERLRERLEPAYTQLQAALDDTRRAAGDPAGELRVGFTGTTQGEALTSLASAFETSRDGCRVILHEVDIFGPYAALRHGQVDVLVNWLALDEPDLTAGPAIDYRERMLAVCASHPLAKRRSVQAEELADYENVGFATRLPAALMDAIIPPRTPSGRPIRRHPKILSIGEAGAEVARGRIIHPTVAGVLVFRRNDIVLVPIEGLPPLPLGLIWCTSHENARIRGLAATAASIAQPAPHGRTAIPGPEPPATRAAR
jgi:DNA-binding transcriptional LysR family regulator